MTVPEAFSYHDLRAAHECVVPNPRKKAFFSVMEDGQIALMIAEPHPEDAHLTGVAGDPLSAVKGTPVRWKILEYIHMSREDFNTWMHASRGWWQAEKLHPTVPSTYRKPHPEGSRTDAGPKR